MAEIPLPDEADAGGILFPRRGEAVLFRDFSDLRLFQLPERKNHVLQLFLRELIEKIRLILILIFRLEQIVRAVFMQDIRIMPGRDQICAQFVGRAFEVLEFDLPVAENVRVGRAPRPVFGEKIRKYALHVFFGKVHRIIGYVQEIGDAAHVCVILFRRTGAVRGGFLPVLHEQTDDVVSLLFQEQRGDRGIHPAAHADHYFFLHRITFRKYFLL